MSSLVFSSLPKTYNLPPITFFSLYSVLFSLYSGSAIDFSDTSLGPARRDFPNTRWSRILEFHLADTKQSQGTLEELAREYWKPVYAYIRSRWSKTNEEAKDLTQDFFLWMIESDFVSRADPARGRFRAFVKASLENFLGMDERKRRALKRGGDRRILPLDLPEEVAPLQLPDDVQSPEEILDATWRDQLLSRATRELESILREEGKEAYFNVFRDYFLCESDPSDYREVAERHGIAVSDVSNYLMHAKRRLRSIVSDLVAETVRGPEDLQEEMRLLFGAPEP